MQGLWRRGCLLAALPWSSRSLVRFLMSLCQDVSQRTYCLFCESGMGHIVWALRAVAIAAAIPSHAYVLP